MKYFNEEEFQTMVMKNYSIDLNDETIKEFLLDSIYNYSTARIYLSVLNGYIRINNIELDNEDE